jgi:hypothetical protein
MADETDELLLRDEADIDHEAVVDQETVTSIVERSGTTVIRTYSDGAVQRLTFEDETLAEDYVNSVIEQEG